MNKIEVIRLDVLGVETHYMEQVWIDDENHPEGGSFQAVRKMYSVPRITIEFLGRTDAELIPGAIYSDGVNTFIASSKNDIRNFEMNVETFKVPVDLICLSNPYSVFMAGTGDPS